jgi:hypothetical protein
VNTEQKSERKGVTRKQLYVALASIGAIAGFAVSSVLALNKPLPEETVTQNYESTISYVAQSPVTEDGPTTLSESDTEEAVNPAEPVNSSEPVLKFVPDSRDTECEAPIESSDTLLVLEFRPCDFSYFKLEENGDLLELTEEEANQIVKDKSDRVDWAPAPAPEGSGNSDSSGTAPSAPEPETISEPAPGPAPITPLPEPKPECPIDRATNPAVYDACKAGFVMPDSLTSTGILSCSAAASNDVSGTMGYTLNGGSFASTTWQGAESDGHRNASRYFRVRGLTEDSGSSVLEHFTITVNFWSMDSRYHGIIAEKTFTGKSVDDVGKCF